MIADDLRANFAYLSGEYAQAVQALKALENQSSTLLLLGGSDELRTFIDQFIVMAERVRAEAKTRDEPDFVEWFDELIDRAEALLVEIAHP